MTTQNASEKDPRRATSSPANAHAETEAPPEIAQDLTDEALRSVSGGAYQTTSWPGAEKAQIIKSQKV
jgi:hypothetical protein